MTPAVTRLVPDLLDELPSPGAYPSLYSLALLPDGRRLMALGKQVLYVWELDTGACVYVDEIDATCRDGDAHLDLVVDPARARFATADGVREFALWDLDTFRKLRVFAGHTEEVYAFLFLDERRGLSGSGDSTVRLWDLDTGACLQTVDTRPVRCMADDRAGGRVAVGHTRGVTMLERAGLGLVREILLEFHCAASNEHWPAFKRSPSVRALAFHPDGEHLLCAGRDGVVKMLHLESGACTRVWVGHDDEVATLVVTRDGRRLVTAGDDGSIRCWDIASPACVMRLELGCPVTDLCLAHGDRVFATSMDGHAYTFVLPPDVRAQPS